MTKIYACLAGNWVCLNDDPDCTISDYRKTPFCWWKEGAILCPREIQISDEPENIEFKSFYELDYVYIFYKGKRYRISPIFIQIEDE